jgi:tryptophan synthase alpha chain
MAEAGASGLERIAASFDAARTEGRAALMPYMMGGFPDLETSRIVAEAYVDGGADLIELGVPYSDPLADGPVIHAAATAALESGASLDDVLGVCAGLAERLPILPMVYANMALARGAGGFAEALLGAGACGAIVPDLPPGEDAELPLEMARRGLALIPFVAPTTPAARRRRLLSQATGFTYVVSLTGVTGEREALPEELAGLVTAVRKESSVPAAVGFGIGTPERAAEIGRFADGVIVGSRLVREVAEARSPAAAAGSVGTFLRRAREQLAAGAAPR